MDARIGDWVVTPRSGKAVEINALWYNALAIYVQPQNPDYRPTYQGSLFLRDSAYHQGTVWARLLGPYLTALVRVRGITGRKQGLNLLQAVRDNLSEAGIGQISEIFDGDAPHTPRGCIAQAWSVAEIGRAYVEDLLDVGKEKNEQPSAKPVASKVPTPLQDVALQ
jgi:glycogen debranching enzyme